jgi:hypothetical protein
VIYPHHLVVPAKSGTKDRSLQHLALLGPRLRGSDGIEEVQ